MRKTGWDPPPLMQDDNPQLSRWFATRPDARYVFIKNQKEKVMDDDAEIWQALKAHAKKKFDDDRKNFMTQALLDDDGGWTKHTQWHWSRTVDGQRLDYWPSRKKFQYKGTVYRGLRLMHAILKGESK